MLTIRLEQDAMLDAPIYQSHRRGRNWCAIIAKNPSAPNGLDRNFLTHARGQYYYMLNDQITEQTPVEFGADYYSAGGRPSRERWYGVVISRTNDALVLEEYDTALAAINAAKQAVIDPDHITALEAEAAQLRSRLAVIEQELENFRTPQEAS